MDISFYLKGIGITTIDETILKKPEIISDEEWKNVLHLTEFKFGKAANQKFVNLATKMSEMPKDIERF
jgi:hypothetical protein